MKFLTHAFLKFVQVITERVKGRFTTVIFRVRILNQRFECQKFRSCLVLFFILDPCALQSRPIIRKSFNLIKCPTQFRSAQNYKICWHFFQFIQFCTQICNDFVESVSAAKNSIICLAFGSKDMIYKPTGHGNCERENGNSYSDDCCPIARGEA